ncbi:MAG TPA: family 1 encapsulin nanocompartment shell protein [Phycisphaerae bacterium]|nr:family 1 encapsulin nanocompartment shell protein [Phycisphaerae bacterium]HNU44017.1 family 1 encapsulin nanocompartment shell protein [Phycisphaerae bacterium]
MLDLLKRSLAPITAEAWQAIDATASRVIKSQLTARTIVDFDGPHGWQLGAVNTGRLDIPKKKSDVPWGARQMLPLVETRMPFLLNQMEIDGATRGCEDVDLSTLEQAAKQVARFEESAIYLGFADGGLGGIIPSTAHKPITLPPQVRQYPEAVGAALEVLGRAGIGGPYALVLGSKAYYPLMQCVENGYPPRRIVRDLLQGDILWSPVLDGGVLLSTRGGDFQLTVGVDFAIGYAGHTREQVELYLTESFAFRVLEPAAAVTLKLPA